MMKIEDSLSNNMTNSEISLLSGGRDFESTKCDIVQIIISKEIESHYCL